jgi:hypothetical protein
MHVSVPSQAVSFHATTPLGVSVSAPDGQVAMQSPQLLQTLIV